MNTQIIDWNDKKKAVTALQNQELVCFPTETVYGIAAIANSESAFKKLVEAKKRPPEKPFTLMCASIGQAVQFAEVDVGTIAVMKRFMPGQITLLLKARKGLDPWLTLGSDTIGVRVPDCDELLDLIERVECPLLVPSANTSGQKPALTCDEAKSYFDGKCEVIIDGKTSSSIPSTIACIKDGNISLVRQGLVSFEEMAKVYSEASMTVSLGSDHGGFVQKEAIKEHLQNIGISVLDFGTDSLASCDYPLFGKAAAKAVVEGKADFGIVVCTSGEGISIAANKVPGVRCGIGYDDVVTQKTREHNNANVIAFGAKYMATEDVLRRVDIFLSEKFSKFEKHHKRVDMLE